MATAREESNPYDGGLGAGGKFRKRPFRRAAKTTPYDRPPTSIRNPSGTGGRDGWLSKLVDPARRLITSSAHRLFASVFMKRLAPPPPQTPQTLDCETDQEPRGNQPGATSTVPPIVQRATIGLEIPSNHTEESGVADLEEILKQKTFTRSEIDRLTSLLLSRSADISGGNDKKSSELSLDDKKEEYPKTPVRENVTESHLISTPIVSSTVIDEVVASPAELGKAFMGSRTAKVSVSWRGLQNQVPGGELTIPSNKDFPSTSSAMSLVPTSSGRVGSFGNSFVTPRSRGRSAIHSMARTPYSRVNSSSLIKNSGTASDAFGGPSSSSQTAWKQDRIPGSRQGVLKRRISVLDDDIGLVGPIRRIRQKSNLLSSRNLSLPVSPGPLSAHLAGTSSSGLDILAENGDNSTPGTSVTTVPSKSSQMASKILQQLEMLVSPGEKSPTKLSSSMLHGQARKSLENVDSSKFLENMHDTDKISGSHTPLPGFHDSMSDRHDKVKENGKTKNVPLSDKPVPAVNGADTISLMKDNNVPSVKAADSSVIKSVVQQSQQKSRAFQMSAHEDYLDLDDDDNPNGATPADGRRGLDDCFIGSKSAAPEAIVANPSSLSEVKLNSTAAFNLKPDLKTSGGSIVENNVGINFPAVEVATSSMQSAIPSTPTANKDAVTLHSNASMPSTGVENAAGKQSNAAVTTFGFAATNVGEVPSVVTGSSGVKLATSSDQKPENSSSFVTTAPGTTNYLSDKMIKENYLNGISCRTPEAAVTSSVSTSASAGSIFKFGASTDGSTSNNGSLASSPFSFSSPTPSLVPSNAQNLSRATASSDSAAATTYASATTNATASSTSSSSVEASTPPFTAAPVFKFSSGGDPTTSTEAIKSKNLDTSLGNVGIFSFGGRSEVTSNTTSATADVASSENSTFSAISSTITNTGSGFFSSTFSTVTSTGNGIFGGTSGTTSTGNGIFGGTSATTSTGNGIFGGTPATASTGSSIFGGTSLPTASTIFSTKPAIPSTGSNIFGFSSPAAPTSTTETQGLNPFNAVNTQASAAGTGIGTSTQSMPIQFSSPASSPAFGLAGSSTFSTGSSMFGSGPTFGMSSSASVTNSLSSSSGIASSTFGSSWQTPKTPVFGSSPSGFSFGSSTSVSAPSSAPTIFGSSTGASSSSLFSFTSAAAATPSQPVFGNTSPGLVFGSTLSNNNDQMEDSMAEDTVQGSPTVPTFGQQPISPPASGFVFGASNPPGAAGSFQYGSQQNIAATQNSSPFTSSSSLEFGAGGGGSFSLGTNSGDKSGRKFVKVRKQRKR